MVKRALPVFVAAGLALGLAGRDARATDLSPNDKIAVVALYNEGRDLFDAGRYGEACPKLEQARAIDPTAFMLRMDLGACYERIDKLLSAYNEYFEAAALARNRKDPRERDAVLKADLVQPKLARIRIQVDAEVAKLPGFGVRLNGAPVLPPSWNSDSFVDLGAANVEASASGHRTWSVTMNIEPKARRVAIVPMLEADGLLATAPPMRPAPPTLNGPRIGALALGGGGIVALAVSGALALGANAKNMASADACAGNLCDARGVELRTEAIARSNAATAFAIGGAAAIAGGVAIWVVAAPTADAPSFALGVAPNGVAAKGRF